MKLDLVWVGVLIVSAGNVWGQTPSTMPVASQQALVNDYCSGCYNDASLEGEFFWTTIDLADPAQNAAQAEKVIRELRAGMIPSAGEARPSSADTKREPARTRGRGRP